MPNDYDGHELEPFLECAYILDEKFVTVAMIDQFLEFVWTERYIGHGDFELVVPVTLELAKIIKLNRYVSIKESSTIMVIESIVVSTDVEGGDKITVKGTTLDNFLSRRIIWKKYECNDKKSLQDSIKILLDQNVINPTDSKRKIPNFIFKESSNSKIIDLTAAFSEEHSNLYSVIESVCEEKELGFRVNTNTETGEMTFELYFGVDRSWDQEVNPVVLFSNSYENLISSEYVQNEEKYVSSVLVNTGQDSTTELFRKPERVGLARREGYFTINFEEGETKTKEAIVQKTKEALKDNGVTKGFDGEVDPYRQFIFNKDYFLGDIVQLENHYGFSGRCRITEVVKSRDDRGPIMTPTFVIVDDEEVVVERK